MPDLGDRSNVDTKKGSQQVVGHAANRGRGIGLESPIDLRNSFRHRQMPKTVVG